MGIGAGEWDIEVPLREDPARDQRSERIFVKLAVGLVGIRDERAATRIAAIFEDENSSEQQRRYAINELRTRVIDFREIPSLGMPPFGHVLDKANMLADVEDQTAVPELISQYVEKHRPADSPFSVGRRTAAAIVTEVA